MKVEFIIILFLSLISCKKEDPTPYPKTFPFECDGNYFVRLDSTVLNKNDLFTLNNSKIFYAFSENYLLKINYNTLLIDSNYLNITYPIFDFSICPNNKIWIIHPEKNYDYFSEFKKISLIDTLGNIIHTISIKHGGKMIATADNGLLIVDDNYTDTIHKIILSRYNESADLLWEKEYLRKSSIRKVIETSSKDFIICGHIFKIDGNDIYGYVAKFNQNGELLWEKNNDNLSDIDNVIEQPLNNYVFTTYLYNPSVFKLDSIGNLKWETQIKNRYSFYTSLLKSEESDIIVCLSESNNSNDEDFSIIKINNDGVINWKKTYGGTGDETFIKAFEIPNIGYYLIGTSLNYLGTGHWGYYGEMWENDFSIKNYFVKTDFNGESCK